MDCATDVYVVCNCHYNLYCFEGGSGEEILRYGSVERSDDDLYKMLNMSDTERVADAKEAALRSGLQLWPLLVTEKAAMKGKALQLRVVDM